MKQVNLRHFLTILAFSVVVCSMAVAHAAVAVTDVSVQPRWPWNGLVDITYSLASDDEAVYIVSFSGYDRDLDRTLTMAAVTGDGVDSAVQAGGPYTVTWDATQDEPEFHSSSFEVTITATVKENDGFDSNALYLVVDLSKGANATNYPVRYTNTAPDLSDDTCRTTELWLRRIPKGTFWMGSPDEELGRQSNETRHEVTLTQDYYIGVFECTQRQYELVTGSNPSSYKGTTRPVEQVSYNDLRGSSADGGAGWPAYGHAVDASSFFGVLRAKTGLLFDLPTEAQWEYACRAGTTTALNSGKDLTAIGQCPNLAEVGRYYYNQNDGKGGYSLHTKVGSYLPNAWGLYDMHGNVFEWCLDWYQKSLGSSAVTDPVGASSGSYRVLRGGDWDHYAQNCRSAYRINFSPSSYYDYIGFRVCLP